METLKTILLLIAVAWGAVSCYQWYAHKDFVPPAAVDELVDEVTRVQSARVESLEYVNQRISERNEVMAARISEQDEELVLLSELSGRLRVYEDSVQTLQSRLNMRDVLQTLDDGSLSFTDTTLTRRTTYSSGLFEVTCFVTFSRDGCILLESDLQQLRDIDMMVGVTDRGSGYLNAYLHLPDFDLEESLQFTYQPDPVRERERSFLRELRPYAITAVGVVGGVLVLKAVF